MHGFWRCALYLAVLGVAAHPLGQALPRKWFCAEKAPWRSAPWEKGSDPAVLVQETCVAECVHWALTLLSAGIFFLWRSGWAALLWLVYNVLGNVSFIVIQRYNRPRLQKLAEKTRRRPV